MNKLWALFLGVSLAVVLTLLSGCGGVGQPPPPPPPQQPPPPQPPPPQAPQVTLSASPNSIAAGASATLSWSTQNATSLTIDNGIGQVAVPSGSVMVHPAATTSYTATASGPGGNATGGATVTVQGTTAGGPINHIFIVVLENTSFSEVIGTQDMPNLDRMARTFGLATNYFANARDSIGDYFEMTAGQLINTDPAFSGTVTADNIVRHLIAANKTWREYSEDLPSVGYTGPSVGGYLQFHNPLSYFSDVRGTAQANNLVPFTQLQADINAGVFPNYAFIVPNNIHNSHNSDLGTADTWLQNFIFQPLLNTPPFQANGDGLLVVVFDESDTGDTQFGGGHVPVVLIGPQVKLAFQGATFYQHQSLLRTACDKLGLTSFADATTATPMSEFFK